ncbi:MAG: HAD-IIA family hydrolase [Candidatus Micrarchaeota archaeon]
MAPKFSRIVFDLDGVIYRGHTPIAGAAEAVERIRAAGMRVSFLTNNATRSRLDLKKRLSRFGVEADVSDIMTSAYATARYLKSLKPRAREVFVVGEEGLREEIRQAGLPLLPGVLDGEQASATTFSRIPSEKTARNADVLVCGLDRQITYAKLASALEVLHSGAKWIACNLDPTLPMETGAHPGSGSLIASLAYAAGKIRHGKEEAGSPRRAGAHLSNIILHEPDYVVGKPNPYMLELLLGGKNGAGAGRAGNRPSVLFVGDRLDMDIGFANTAGLSSMLVLTGVSTKEEAKKAKGHLKPRYILSSVADVPEWLGI